MRYRDLVYIIKIVFITLVISFSFDKVVFFTLNYISDNVLTGQSIGKLNHYLRVKDSIDLVVFGSSRANHHVNPQMISENSFNMGLDGKDIAYSVTLIKLLPKRKKQLVLLHLDPNGAFNKEYKAEDLKALKTKYNRSQTIRTEINQKSQENILQVFYWSLSYNGYVLGIIKNYLQPNYDYKNYYGYDPLYVSESQKKIFENIIKKDEPEDCLNNLELNSLYSIYLKELKEFCKENNKTLIIFTSPKYKDNCNNDNIKFSNILKNMGIPYYDYTHFFKNNNSFNYWKDNTHLSNEGAKIFTNEVSMKFNTNIPMN